MTSEELRRRYKTLFANSALRDALDTLEAKALDIGRLRKCVQAVNAETRALVDSALNAGVDPGVLNHIFKSVAEEFIENQASPPAPKDAA
jgi:hypothetical protein